FLPHRAHLRRAKGREGGNWRRGEREEGGERRRGREKEGRPPRRRGNTCRRRRPRRGARRRRTDDVVLCFIVVKPPSTLPPSNRGTSTPSAPRAQADALLFPLSQAGLPCFEPSRHRPHHSFAASLSEPSDPRETRRTRTTSMTSTTLKRRTRTILQELRWDRHACGGGLLVEKNWSQAACVPIEAKEKRER
ncbi:unnamed protein product, partial [Urochloa humidicola]